MALDCVLYLLRSLKGPQNFPVMKYIKILLLAVFVASTALSCVTSSKCRRKFPTQSDTIKIVHTKDSIIIKDTTIYIHLPGEVVHDSIEIPCPDPGPAYIPKKVYAETSLAKASAWFQWPNIKLELIQKDTLIVKKLENAIKEMYHYKNLYTNVTNTLQPVKYVPGIYKIALWLWAGVILAVAGYVAVRLFVLKR